MRFLCILFVVSTMLCESFAQANTSNITIEIKKVRSNNGNIFLQLFDENKMVVKESIQALANNRCEIQFDNLVRGSYAIRYFHDENNNRKLDTNWMGIPTEGYGFSNNAKGMFGPPRFKDWLFTVSSDLKITLLIHY